VATWPGSAWAAPKWPARAQISNEMIRGSGDGFEGGQQVIGVVAAGRVVAIHAAENLQDIGAQLVAKLAQTLAHDTGTPVPRAIRGPDDAQHLTIAFVRPPDGAQDLGAAQRVEVLAQPPRVDDLEPRLRFQPLHLVPILGELE